MTSVTGRNTRKDTLEPGKVGELLLWLVRPLKQKSGSDQMSRSCAYA